jgi:predicted RNA polymerase sigma factor
MVESPMVALNRAVALAMVEGPLAGLAEVERIAPRLPGHHRVEAVRAHLLERAGRRQEARAAYARAAELAVSVPERDYLMMRAARLGGS